MYENFGKNGIVIKSFKAVRSVRTDGDSKDFFVPTIEAKVNGPFADRFGQKKTIYKWHPGVLKRGRWTKGKFEASNTDKNVLYMNLRFDKYNSMNFKLVLADDGETVAVSHRKKGIIKSMRWNTYDVAKAIVNKVNIQTEIRFMNGSEIVIRPSATNIYDKIQEKPNIFRTSVRVGHNVDGSRHDHGCAFRLNKRELVNF